MAGPPSDDEVTDPAACTVSVRNLCAFAAKSGDLDLRFTPSPTAQQGREGHVWVAQRRGPQHESEISLQGRCQDLLVRGRADGFDPHSRTLEEVKTFRGALADLPPQHQALHWAQLKVYGWLMCQSRGLEWLNLSVVYFDVVEQTETPLHMRMTADALRVHFEALCHRYLAWARLERAHRLRRDAALARCAFPQLPFRAGQRDLAAAVYRACVAAQSLLVQAPTGIGKTIGTVYPALRAMPQRGTDKLFFLTAKTTGRPVALEALQQIRGGTPQGTSAMPLRVIELVAKDKACAHPDKACHGDSCPLARGFYDRLADARHAAAQVQWLDQQALRAVALAHAVCPYYLGHEMVRWSDVVVGDYNYYFDRTAMLYALMLDSHWRVSVLVDEAHNLVPRGCAMYSADLCHAETLAVRSHAPAALRGRVDALLDQWQLLQDHHERLAPGLDWTLRDGVPQAWLRALQRLNQSLGEHVATTAQAPAGPVLPFYFRTLAIAALAESFGDHSLCEFSRETPATPVAGATPQGQLEGSGFDEPPVTGRVRLRNIVPGHFLASRLLAADALVLFSATLQPAAYYLGLLGLPPETPQLDVPSPFHSAQLTVRVVPISTRRDQRQRSLGGLVASMAAQFGQARGNYLAFFSSFEYMEQACAHLRAHHPAIPVWLQARQTSEAARRDFLARFAHAGHGIGFAVLGGVFGEGVDLPGTRLIGAFVATLGLPQFDPVNEAIRARMDERFGNGYDYTYVYPGLQKVVQAAGRVIRSETDTGCVLLLDTRYQEPRYRALLPSWWQIASPDPTDPSEVTGAG
ncbi:MAG: ATP-dependent DNA helicase [Burkholderiaceae bacterium]